MLFRSIVNATVFRAAAVLTLALTVCATGFLLLLAVEPYAPEKLAFETFSAFGTVGLSMGVTPHLSRIGKAVVIALMFVGRVGPLTLVLSMRPMRTQRIFYPRANVMVG